MDQIKDLIDQLRKHPNRPDLHNSLGGLYQQKGDAGEASKHFLAAARLFSVSDSPLRNMNKAIVILKKLVRDFPSHHDSYYLNRDAGMPFHAAQAFVQAASLGLKMKKGEPPVELAIQALKLDSENTEAHELFRTLAGLGEAGAVHEEKILELAEEVDRNGQYEQENRHFRRL